MDNNMQPKFDPETGRPLNPEPQSQPAPKFDPETGRPLNPEPQSQPAPKFDPETGRPLNPEPQSQPAPKFDPETGRPLNPEPQPQQLNSQPNPAPNPGSYTPPQQGQPYTQQTPYTEQPAPAKAPANGLAVGSLICGLLSLICCCCGWLSVALGVAAVVFAVMSKKNAPKMTGMALGGMICGIIGGGFALISSILGLFMSSTGVVEDILSEFSINHGYEDISPSYDIYDFFE